jgi:hypothetical protein
MGGKGIVHRPTGNSFRHWVIIDHRNQAMLNVMEKKIDAFCS